MEGVDYQSVISDKDIRRFPISITTTEVNLTGSWRFSKPVFKEKISPCSVGCPANTNIPLYIKYILKNDMNRAVEVLRGENPFPATCGRVCPHFCQFQCNRQQYDGAVRIREIERFVGDYGLTIPFKNPEVRSYKKVAVVGGGPAGLSCAYFLAINGYRVDLFERENILGGLLIYGIPDYRLPKDIPQKEINNIIALENINVHYNSDLGMDDLNRLKKEFDAVFVAVGLSEDRLPENIKVDNKNIFSGYELLKQINLGRLEKDEFKGKKVGVIGGGNVTFDVARTILRSGSDVEIIYRRTLKEAPSFEEEKEEALDEGVKIRERRVVGSIEKNENSRLTLNLRGVERIENGKPIFNDISEKVEVDLLIIATGQKRSFDIEERDNLFTGGDFKYGAKTVIEAIASGKEAAFKIMAFLENGQFKLDNEKDSFLRANKDYDEYSVVGFEKINLAYFDKQEPLQLDKVDAKERARSFSEVSLNPPLEKILQEAKRCFSCGVCNECKTCWFFCPDMCIGVKEGVEFDYNFCKGCGVCSQECPRGVIEMVEDK